MASNFYRKADAPRYVLGHSLEIGFICAGIIALVIQVITYRRINANRERECAEGKWDGVSDVELSELGDRAATFRYTL